MLINRNDLNEIKANISFMQKFVLFFALDGIAKMGKLLHQFINLLYFNCNPVCQRIIIEVSGWL